MKAILKIAGKENVLLQQKQATRVIWVSSVNCIFILVERNQSIKYKEENLWCILEYYITKITGEVEAIKLLESDA